MVSTVLLRNAGVTALALGRPAQRPGTAQAPLPPSFVAARAPLVPASSFARGGQSGAGLAAALAPTAPIAPPAFGRAAFVRALATASESAVQIEREDDPASAEATEHTTQIEIEDDPADGPLDPVHQAIKDGDLEALRAALKNGGDANAVHGKTTKNTVPALVRAATRDVALVKLLLDHGADPDAQDFVQDYPITMAARCDNVEVVKLLESIQKDSNFDAVHQALVATANQNRANSRTYLLDLGYRTTRAC